MELQFRLSIYFACLLFFSSSCSALKDAKDRVYGGGSTETGPGQEGNHTDPKIDPKPVETLEHISQEQLSTFNEVDRVKLQLRDRAFAANLPKSSTLSLTDIQNLSFDPISFNQCGDYANTEKFKELSDELGGFHYKYRLKSEENHRNPIFVKDFNDVLAYPPSAIEGARSESIAADSNDSASDFVVEIKRADLIGRFGDKVLYLSKVYGLFFVKLEEQGPQLSCYLLQPGDAKNFYIHNDTVVMLLNGIYPKNNAAVIRYKIEDTGLSYLDHHILNLQKIVDSRLFNDSLAVFANLYQTENVYRHNKGSNFFI